MQTLPLMLFLLACGATEQAYFCRTEVAGTGDSGLALLEWSLDDLPASIEHGTWSISWVDYLSPAGIDTVEMTLTPRGEPVVHRYLETSGTTCTEGDLYVELAYDGTVVAADGWVVGSGTHIIEAASPDPADIKHGTIGSHEPTTIPDDLLALAEAEAADFEADSWVLRMGIAGTQQAPTLDLMIDMSGPRGEGGGALARGELTLVE